jgi:hypothetical protein
MSIYSVTSIDEFFVVLDKDKKRRSYRFPIVDAAIEYIDHVMNGAFPKKSKRLKKRERHEVTIQFLHNAGLIKWRGRRGANKEWSLTTKMKRAIKAGALHDIKAYKFAVDVIVAGGDMKDNRARYGKCLSRLFCDYSDESLFNFLAKQIDAVEVGLTSVNRGHRFWTKRIERIAFTSVTLFILDVEVAKRKWTERRYERQEKRRRPEMREGEEQAAMRIVRRAGLPISLTELVEPAVNSTPG